MCKVKEEGGLFLRGPGANAALKGKDHATRHFVSIGFSLAFKAIVHLPTHSIVESKPISALGDILGCQKRFTKLNP